MNNMLSITLNQVLMMFTFMVTGFFMRKKNIGGSDLEKTLSALLVNIFLPCMTYMCFADNFHLDTIAANAKFFIAGALVLAFTFLLAMVFSRMFAQNSLQKDVYMYSFLIPNISYMGFPLVLGVFGETALFYMMIFTIPYNMAIYTYGIYILNPHRELSFKKILNPTIIAMALGMIAGAFYFRLPAFLGDAVNAAKACMSPVAMLMTGYILASAPVKPLLTDLRLYLAALTRAVLIPGIVFVILLLLRADREIILISVATLSMPMGLNSVVFPSAYGGDVLTGAKTTFVSNVISIVTIPVIFMLLGYL